MENRRNLLKLAGLSMAAATLPLGGKEPRLPDSLHDESSAQLTTAPYGEEKIYYNGPTEQLKSMIAGRLMLYPGQEPHPPHQHSGEEFMVVTEGSGEIFVNGVTHHVAAGAMMYSEGNKLHGVKNTGSTPMVFYFYKWEA